MSESVHVELVTSLRDVCKDGREDGEETNKIGSSIDVCIRRCSEGNATGIFEGLYHTDGGLGERDSGVEGRDGGDRERGVRGGGGRVGGGRRCSGGRRRRRCGRKIPCS